MNIYVPFFEFDLETTYFENNEKRAVYILIYFENRIEAPDIKAPLDIADRLENALRKDIKVYYDYTTDQLHIETQSTKIYKTEYISDSFDNSPDQENTTQGTVLCVALSVTDSAGRDNKLHLQHALAPAQSLLVQINSINKAINQFSNTENRPLCLLSETRSFIFVTNRSLSEWDNMGVDKHTVSTFRQRILMDAQLIHLG